MGHWDKKWNELLPLEYFPLYVLHFTLIFLEESEVSASLDSRCWTYSVYVNWFLFVLLLLEIGHVPSNYERPISFDLTDPPTLLRFLSQGTTCIHVKNIWMPREHVKIHGCQVGEVLSWRVTIYFIAIVWWRIYCSSCLHSLPFRYAAIGSKKAGKVVVRRRR